MTSTQALPGVTMSSTPLSLQETNPVILCRMGQDALLEIVQKTTEIFSYIRTQQLPNGMNMTLQQFTDRKTKLDDPLRHVESLFSRLRQVYDAVVELSSTVEAVPVEELLPVMDCVDESESCAEGPSSGKNWSNEEKRLIEQIRVKNRQLKELIDLQRMLIWEINTMMSTRRTSAADK